MFDRDRNGTIDFNEFFALWEYVTNWSNTFRHYDLDNSGTIDKKELAIGKAVSFIQFYLKIIVSKSYFWHLLC